MMYFQHSLPEVDDLLKSCLVISDSDLIIDDYMSIDQIELTHIRHSQRDTHLANMVLYDGRLGQKVLKLRMPKIRRDGLGGYIRD